MLLWQPQNPPEYRILIKRCFVFSLVFHSIGVIGLLFIYKDYHQRLSFTLSKQVFNIAKVKVLPLSASRTLQKTIQSKSHGLVKVPHQLKGVNKQKECLFASSTSSTTVRTVPSQKKQQKKQQKKELLNKVKKESLKKKKVAVPVKQEGKKEYSAKVSEKQAKEEQEKDKKQDQLRFDQTKKMKEETSLPLSLSDHYEKVIENKAGPVGQDFVYVTQQEYDALQVQQKLQETLFDQWRPPMGVPEKALCEVVVAIDWEGKVFEVEYLKKSLIVVYDMSVQEALEQVLFPHELWGKRVTITFKP